ncbi:MAG: hypothetical protein CL917_07705 [Deltaproteobacteria bacterium]|nr:hypothetical protein [Deltaproteobacteria bacterium]
MEKLREIGAASILVFALWPFFLPVPAALGSEGDCTVDSDCAQAQFCLRDSLSCSGVGTCEDIPEICIEIYEPVCACDGVTYSNFCVAHSAGLNVDHQGECEVTTQAVPFLSFPYAWILLVLLISAVALVRLNRSSEGTP